MRPREAGGQGRDPGDAGEHVSQLVDVRVGEVVEKDVADPGAVRDERQRPAVRCPRGVDVLPLIHVTQQLDRAVLEVEQRDPHVAEFQRREVGPGAAVGDEGDRLAVGGPGRLEVRVLVVREALQARPVGVHDEQVRQAAVVPGEHDPRAIRRPGRRGKAVEGDADAAELFVLLHVEDHEVVAILVLRRDREVAPVRGERARRIDEPQALIVRVERGLHQPPDDSPRLRIREIEIHEKRVLLAEVGDVVPVGGEGRGQVERAFRAPFREQRLGDAPGAVVVGELRQERRLNRVAPLAREVIERHPERAFEAAVDAGGHGGLQDLTDRFIAPLFSHECPERMAEPIRKDPGVERHLLNGRQVAFEGGVP